MKLFLPIFNQKTDKKNMIGFPIIAGASFFNPKYLGVGLPEADLLIQAWDGFHLVQKKRISFKDEKFVSFYLDQLFSESELEKFSLVTVEFDPLALSPELMRAKYGLFEMKSLLKTPFMEAGVLYDLIGDKKLGHKYSPILHPFHAGLTVQEEGTLTTDTFCLFVNFRPPEISPYEANLHKPFEKIDTQALWIGFKKANGEVVKEEIIEVPYNSTKLISLGEAFTDFGGYSYGDQIIFKGGASQFAIFNLFVNKKNQSIGIEHSLPPVYYSSGLFEAQQRNRFYQRAFQKFQGRDL